MNMKKKLKKTDTPKWLSENLKKQVRNVFEPRYKRNLSEAEIITIALELTQFLEHFYQYKRRKDAFVKNALNRG